MNIFFLTIIFFGSVFAEDLFDFSFSFRGQELELTAITTEEKPNLAPLILLDQYVDKENQEIHLFIEADCEAMCAQVIGRRIGKFSLKGVEDGIYSLIVNNKGYGKLYILNQKVTFEPFLEEIDVE